MVEYPLTGLEVKIAWDTVRFPRYLQRSKPYTALWMFVRIDGLWNYVL